MEFFEQNLRYRQCRRCKFIIEKSAGCNHMRCRCGYQFCYVCGKRWAAAHYGNHDDQGNILREGNNYEYNDCCACCEECCLCD